MSMKSILTREVNIGVSTVTFVFRWPHFTKSGLWYPQTHVHYPKNDLQEKYHLSFLVSEGTVTNLAIWLVLFRESPRTFSSVAIWNEFVVANVSLNGLTRDLKQISINVSLSQRVTQKVKAARCLFKIKLIDGTFIHFISEVSQSIRLVLPQIRFHSLQVDLFNLAIFTVNCTKKKPMNSTEKKPN